MYTEVVANSNTQSQSLRRVPILIICSSTITLKHRIGVRYPENSEQDIQLQIKTYIVARYKIEWVQNEVLPLS